VKSRMTRVKVDTLAHIRRALEKLALEGDSAEQRKTYHETLAALTEYERLLSSAFSDQEITIALTAITEDARVVVITTDWDH
jgi:heme oxygenase